MTAEKNPYELALISGDLSKLTADERLSYYKNMCDSIGLNPLTKPFEYIELNKKLVLYATRTCTDQLRAVKGVSIEVVKRETVSDIYFVTARGTDKSGRVDESTGAVSIAGMRGDALANAIMKAETKAKRRVTLSICGLGCLDESELETIPEVKLRNQPAVAAQPALPEPAQETRTLDRSVSQEEGIEDSVLKFGKHKGKKWSELETKYVAWLSESSDPKFVDIAERAKLELDLRAGTNMPEQSDRDSLQDDDLPEELR